MSITATLRSRDEILKEFNVMPRPSASRSSAPVFTNQTVSAPIVNKQFKHGLNHHVAQYDENKANASAHQRYFASDSENPFQDTGPATWGKLSAEFTKQRLSRSRYLNEHQSKDGRSRSIHLLANDVSVISDACCTVDQSQQQSTSKADQKNTPVAEHSHDHGVIAVDLDEAVHGAYAASKQIIEVAQGDPQSVVNSFRDDANFLATKPIEYLKTETIPDGVADFSAAVGIGAAMLPLAGLAMHAGLHEMKHAKSQKQQLSQSIQLLSESIKRDQAIQKAVASSANDMQSELVPQLQTKEVRLKTLKFGLSLAKMDWAIGFSSFSSGLSIGLKAVSDIAIKVSMGVKGALSGKGFFGFSDTVQQTVALGATATGFGIAATFALGPLAGLFATALGTFFTIKSVKKRNQLKRDVALVKSDLRSNIIALESKNKLSESALRYQSFIERVGERRIKFFQGFARWNKRFLIGSGLYAASATTKAIVAGLAIAGVAAAASNPITLGVIIGVGVLGALVMGISSWVFLTGHDKQGRYARQTTQEHYGVDRQFLLSLDAIRNVKNYSETLDTQHNDVDLFDMGLTARSACLEWLDQRKSATKKLWQAASLATGKLAPNDKHRSIWQRVRGRWLNEEQLAQWLNSEDGKREVIQFFQGDIEKRVNFLHTKMKIRDVLNSGVLLSDPEQTDSAQISQYAQYLSEVDAHYEQDQSELEKALHLRDLLSRFDSADDSSNVQTAALPDFERIHSLALQYLMPQKQILTEQLGRAFLRDIAKDTKNARGILFESQLEASRLTKYSIEQLVTT